MLMEHRQGKDRKPRRTEASLLTGLLFDERGNRFTPTHAIKAGQRYRYYTSQAVIRKAGERKPASRIPAHELEEAVIGRLLEFLRSPDELLRELRKISDGTSDYHGMIRCAEKLARGWSSMARQEREQFLRSMVARLVVENGSITIQVKSAALADLLGRPKDFSSAPNSVDSGRETPFPIAVVQRKIRNAPNNTQKFSLLIELFEVAVRFIVLVQLADYVNNRRQAAVVAEQVPDIKKLFAPSLGDWVSLFKAFARIKSAAEITPFLAEIKAFRLDKYQRTLQEFVDVRNASLRGHGATLTEDEYELRFQEHAPKVYDLISSLGFLANYTLLKTGSMEKDGDFYRITVQLLMGDNPHFDTSHIVLRTPLDTNKVLYLNREQESLVLDPFIVLERCPECRRPEVLLFDKLSDTRITYLGYESGHRPALANADRLSPIIREIATRRQ